MPDMERKNKFFLKTRLGSLASLESVTEQGIADRDVEKPTSRKSRISPPKRDFRDFESTTSRTAKRCHTWVSRLARRARRVCIENIFNPTDRGNDRDPY